jgi:FKBP-type peptidyl-prolyl cis-trans isomerase (trigger factor)
LVRKEIEAKLKVTDEEIKAEIAKVKEANPGISDADAAMRAVKSVSGSRIQKIQEDLIAAAKKETGAAVDTKAMDRIGKEGNVPDNVVLASVGDEKILYGDVKKILRGLSQEGGAQGQPDLSKNPVLVGNILEREVTMRALSAYAKKQGIDDGSEVYKSMRREMERFVLRGLMAGEIGGKNVEVTDKEIEAAYAEHAASLVQDGKKIPLAMVKEQIRAALRNEKGKKVIEAYIAELRKKAKITVNDAVLPKV